MADKRSVPHILVVLFLGHLHLSSTGREQLFTNVGCCYFSRTAKVWTRSWRIFCRSLGGPRNSVSLGSCMGHYLVIVLCHFTFDFPFDHADPPSLACLILILNGPVEAIHASFTWDNWWFMLAIESYDWTSWLWQLNYFRSLWRGHELCFELSYPWRSTDNVEHLGNNDEDEVLRLWLGWRSVGKVSDSCDWHTYLGRTWRYGTWSTGVSEEDVYASSNNSSPLYCT